jgi:predicted MFS family arabinose efflux permease
MIALPGRRSFHLRFAAGLAGYCTFINLYSPQAILPLLSEEFGAGPAQISAIMTAGTLAVALIAPFSGTVADVLGRKRVIVTALFALAIPTILSAFSTNLHALIVWRFVQGLCMPPIFAVTIAYIAEELPPNEATAVTGVYTSGASMGGFSGRLFTGVLADLIGWRNGFICLGAMTLFGAMLVAMLLPKERKFVRSEGLIASGRQMLRHFRNPKLVATYAVGFGVLFNFICTFTFVSFRLAAPPYSMSATWLGAIFVVYLIGSGIAPLTGRLISRFGRRHFVLLIIAIWMSGILLTLAPPLPLIVLGLAMMATCGLLCQAVSTAYVAVTAQAGRSSAVGLYVTSFYLGGSVGAAAGGVAWIWGGWPACVFMMVGVLAIMASIVTFAWAREPAQA